VDVVSDRGIKARIRERVLREAVPAVRDQRERLLDMLEAIEGSKGTPAKAGPNLKKRN